MKKNIFSRILSLVLTALVLVGALPIAVWAESSEFSYYTSYDGEEDYAVIDGYYGDGGTVIVPAEIDGYPVRQIGYGVFSDRHDIDHVTLSEGIEHLSGNVFSWSSVKSVFLPSTRDTTRNGSF